MNRDNNLLYFCPFFIAVSLSFIISLSGECWANMNFEYKKLIPDVLDQCSAIDLNNNNEILLKNNGKYYLYADDTLIELVMPTGYHLYGIDNNATIYGYTSFCGYDQLCSGNVNYLFQYFYSKNQYAYINNTDYLWLYDTNDNGDIVGAFKQFNGDQVNCMNSLFSGFYLHEDIVESIHYGGERDTHFVGINNHGTIIGNVQTNNKPGTFFSPHGFIYDGSSFKDVNVPGYSISYLISINNNNDVIGEAMNMGDDPYSISNSVRFILKNDQFQVINIHFDDAFVYSIESINDDGVILGSYSTLDSGGNNQENSYCFLAVPKESKVTLSSIGLLLKSEKK